MGATPYQPISWSDNEPLYTDKLNAMANNEQWLFENAPRMYYNTFGLKKTSGIKILTGFVQLPPGNEHTGNTFYFGTFFSQGCQPVVVASINTFPRGRLVVVTRGIGSQWPDSRGFECRVYSAEPTSATRVIPPGVYAAFIATGW